jgi:hypothetical protein
VVVVAAEFGWWERFVAAEVVVVVDGDYDHRCCYD